MVGKRRKLWLSLVLVGGLGGCAADRPIAVESVYGPTVEVDLAHAWAWAPEQESSAVGAQVVSPTLHALIGNLVETELSRRGYEPAAEEAAFWLDYHITNQRQMDRFEDTASPGSEHGMLVLDVIDPATSTLVWRASANTRIRGTDSIDVREERVDQAVELLVAALPLAR